MWGWKIMHAVEQCGTLVTVHEAEAKFMAGVDNRLRTITEAWCLDHPCLSLEDLQLTIQKLQQTSHNDQLRRSAAPTKAASSDKQLDANDPQGHDASPQKGRL
jgi:hypothetical protein